MSEQPLATQANIKASDRLGFTVFFAIALHLILIMGIGFDIVKNNQPSTSLDVTLAKYQETKEPEDAQFLAQSNQQGSGQDIEEARKLTTDQTALIQDREVTKTSPDIQQTPPSPIDQQAQQQVASEPRELITTIDAKDKVANTEQPAQQPQNLLQRSLEIASLEAELDYQQQLFTRSPRIRTITTTSTKRAVDAFYVKSWLDKVERVGNLNYPEKARKNGIFGDLRLMVTLLPNGTLKRIEVLETSGHRILDDAAIRIVRLAAPFAPFPAELAKDTDELEIIRTWRFQKNNVLSQF